MNVDGNFPIPVGKIPTDLYTIVLFCHNCHNILFNIQSILSDAFRILISQ